MSSPSRLGCKAQHIGLRCALAGCGCHTRGVLGFISFGPTYARSNSGSQNMASFAQLSAPQGPSLGSGNYSSGGYSIFRSK